jgi:hypothetical protein
MDGQADQRVEAPESTLGDHSGASAFPEVDEPWFRRRFLFPVPADENSDYWVPSTYRFTRFKDGTSRMEFDDGRVVDV